MKRSVSCSSSATSACACGWTAPSGGRSVPDAGSARTICSAIALFWLKSTHLPHASIPKLVKPVPTAPGLPSPVSMRIAGTTRKKKGSKNRKKARKHLAKAYLKVQRQREDFARKQANALVSSHDLIAYEDLQIRNMVKNHRLAKSIHDAAWGQFLRWVRYYGVMHGILVVAVPPHYT